MPFNSLPFILFCIIVSLIAYSGKANYRTLILLIASFLFYIQAGFSSICYLLLIIFITYGTIKVIRIYNTRIVYIFSIFIIIILLLSSKYSALPQSINNISAFTLEQSLYIVPIGVSFYSLQAIGLLIDIKKGRFTPHTSFQETALFICFFPMSLAGPIHRAKELIPQFKVMKGFDANDIAIGIKTVLFGFFCKLIVADKLSLVIDPVFGDIHKYNGLLIYSVMILYSFQIYFDFWGYSLIAIGIGKSLGYEIKINFKNPYSAKSIKDFWYRWHISLSQWMRDYIYIPLGGNKNGYIRFLLATFVTFLASSLWHGLSINFIIWGMLHFLIFILDDKIAQINTTHISAITRRILFLLTIPFTWLVFRIETQAELYMALDSVLNVTEWSIESTILYLVSSSNLFYLICCSGIILTANTQFFISRMNLIPTTNREKILDSYFIILCLLLIILFGDIGTQQFLYFYF